MNFQKSASSRGRTQSTEKTKFSAKQLLHDYFPFFKKVKLLDAIQFGSFDIPFFLIVIVLLSIGLVVMFSASYVNSIYETAGSAGGPTPNKYIIRQLIFAVIGLALMYFFSRIKIDIYKDVSTLALLVSIMLLIVVLIHPHIIPGKEPFKRWLGVPPFIFQPSEIAKLGLIMFLAWSLEKRQKLVYSKAYMILPYLAIIGFICVLVYEENHLSATVLIFAISMVMLFMGGIKMRSFIITGGVVLILFAILFLFKKDVIEGYMMSRIESWLDKDAGALGSRWQTNQSLYAIGSGGLFGLGLGNSLQKHMYVPEPQNDFVFSIGCEELGFFRASFIIILFALLVWRGFVIAMRAKDKFSSLLVMGIVFHVGMQAALNIAVVTDLIPNTGIGLPFFSYGGTSLVMLLIEMGVVLCVSRGTTGRKG